MKPAAITFFSWLTLVKGATAHQQGLPTVDLGYEVHRAISFDVRMIVSKAVGNGGLLTDAQETYKTYNFTNIPFAEPPLGPLRFNAPIPPKGRKSGIQDGSVGKVCPQANPNWLGLSMLFAEAYATNQLPFDVTKAKETLSQLPPPPQDGRITEDCLVLDVLVPQKVFDARTIHKQGVRSTGGAPVLVWIYVSNIIVCNTPRKW